MVYQSALGRIATILLGLAVVMPAHAQVPGGYVQTLSWYHQQAAAGNARAQFLLAIKYETGTDLPQDFRRAAELYSRAARQGYADAQFKLATFADRGIGQSPDPVTAKLWYRAAALQSHAPAQYNLAILLLDQAHPDDRAAEVVSWLLRAADSGLAPAARVIERLDAVYPRSVMEMARSLAALPLSRIAADR